MPFDGFFFFSFFFSNFSCYQKSLKWEMINSKIVLLKMENINFVSFGQHLI